MNQVAKIEGKEMQAQKPQRPDEKISAGLITRKSEFEKVLPNHISFEKFQRTVMTACFANPDLLQSDLQSLFLAAMKAATDGLLPDNREAAFVIFNSKVKINGEDRWVKKAQYMPMWNGLLKKIRQSKELSSIVAHVVYEADYKLGKFEYVLGDEERLIHEPYFGTEPRGAIIAAYCIAKLTNGEVIREVMTIQDIEKIRRTSKSGSDKEGNPIGIWKEWPEEMARKTVFRRLSKWLPQSAELIERIVASDASLSELENVAPTEYMDSNPKAQGYIENEPSGDENSEQSEPAQIENNPQMEMPKDQPNLTEKFAVNKAAQAKAEKPAENSQYDAQLEKRSKAIRQAINFEETNMGLDLILDKDFKDDFDYIKKTNAALFQELVDLLEKKRQAISV